MSDDAPPSGALFHGSPRHFAPVHTLIDAIDEISARVGRSTARDDTTIELDLRTLYLKDLRLLGCTIPEPGVFKDLVGYIERGEIRPLVARTYPLAAIADAQCDFISKRHTGKIVLLLEA